MTAAIPKLAGPPGRWTRFARRMWRSRVLYLLLLPTAVSLIAFYYGPLLSGLWHSFRYWDLKQDIFIGLENY